MLTLGLVIGSICVYLVFREMTTYTFVGIASIKRDSRSDWDMGFHKFDAAVFRKGFICRVYTAYETKNGIRIDVTNAWTNTTNGAKKITQQTLRDYPPKHARSLAPDYPLSYYIKQGAEITWLK